MDKVYPHWWITTAGKTSLKQGDSNEILGFSGKVVALRPNQTKNRPNSCKHLTNASEPMVVKNRQITVSDDQTCQVSVR